VTPSLNQARFIESAIVSVAEQSYPRIEHVVVDGGSTDGTLDVLQRHPAVRWISEADRGQADALNKGFAMAGGEIFGWLNADDLYLPGAVEAAVAAFDPGVGLVHGSWRQIDEHGNAIRDVEVYPLVFEELLDRYNPIAQPAAFFTRSALEAVGGLDPRYHYAMDYDLWLKIAARFEVVGIHDRLAAFRLHDEAKTAVDADAFWPEVRRISRRHGSRFFSDMYLRRHPWLRNAHDGYRLLAERRFGELATRAARRVRPRL
jgi:glycosyltransferase involved in cell wall biosynthesis